jgi:hypothetical protein
MVVTKSRKRAPNDEIIQHVSNKRKCVGLDTIPEDAKRKTFDTIPSHVKVDLFNSIVNTAFPNFNNLMIASWNVITIYTACGSDFPDLHKAIADLKGVLQDFDESFGRRVDRAPPRYRDDFGGPARNDADGDVNQGRNGRGDQERDEDCEDDDVEHHGNLFESHVPTLRQREVGTLSESAIALLTKRHRCKRALTNKVTAWKIQKDTMAKTTKYLLGIQIWLSRPKTPAKFVDLAHTIWQKLMLGTRSTLIIITHM